jgi:ferredoxin
MVKIVILYFSGTGNTHYIAHYLRSRVNINEDDVLLESIETFPPDKIVDFDLICFGFPVYACNAPSFVRDYIKQLPLVENKGVFLFCTKGLSAGNAIYKTFRKFKKKGYIFLGHASIKMPGTDGLALLSPDSKYVKKALEKDYDHIDKVDKFVKRINDCIRGLQSNEDIKFFKKRSPIDIPIAVVDLVLAIVYKLMARSFKKKFWSNENCTKCGTCEKICPAKNITVEEDGVKFSNNCFLCMRCIHQCPQEAVQFGKMTNEKFRWKGPKKGFKPLNLLKSE